MRFLEPSQDRCSRGFGQLELDWSLCLALYNHGTGKHLVPVRDVAHAQADQIATPQLTIDCQVEHGEISNSMALLEGKPDRPDILGLEWWLLTDKLSFVPRFTFLDGFHDRLLVVDRSLIVQRSFNGRFALACHMRGFGHEWS
jgi:hypothetical protein